MELRVDLFFALLFLLLLALHYLRGPWRRHQAEVGKRRAAGLQAADIARMRPLDFEHHCAAVLRTQGWSCAVTRASGDFGIDLVARRDGVCVAIQVKKWRKPVNLKAVQEAAAGKPMHGAHLAAVVSVSGYLPSAHRLAKSNCVLLLSYADLYDFSRRVPSARR